MAPRPRYQPQAPFMAGALAGGAEILLTFPLEFLKTEQQLRPRASLRAIATTTMTEHGFRGFYRGLPPWLFFAFPRSAVRFSVFEASITALSPLAPRSSSAAPDARLTAFCGFAAGTAEAATVMTPMQNVQIKTMHDVHRSVGERRYPRFFQSLLAIPRDHGVWDGLFAGMLPTVIKGAVNNMIRFSIYESLKATVARALGKKAQEDHLAVHLLAGAAAGGVSAVVTHPIDTVKAKMMSLHGHSYPSSWQCFTRVYAEGGMAALYRGIEPRVTRVCIEVALQFALFERIARILDLVL